MSHHDSKVMLVTATEYHAWQQQPFSAQSVNRMRDIVSARLESLDLWSAGVAAAGDKKARRASWS
jgi:hypothetical protein